MTVRGIRQMLFEVENQDTEITLEELADMMKKYESVKVRVILDDGSVEIHYFKTEHEADRYVRIRSTDNGVKYAGLL